MICPGKAKTTAADDMRPNNNLTVEQSPDETGAQAIARKLLQPSLKNAVAAASFTEGMLGSEIPPPGITDHAHCVQSVARGAAEGDVAFASRILAAQAIALDSMFAELARRSARNMGEYINASERYGRLALKAQSNCRATLEAPAKLHQPREQTVRHVHVNEGGQAVVADHFHNHRGGGENAKSSEQSHAAGTTGEGASLPSEDPQGNGMPVSSGKGEASMQDARRGKSRGSQRQP